MATIRDVQLNAIERKNLLKLSEQLYKSTHFSKEEVEKLLYSYRTLATTTLNQNQQPQTRIDRSGFRDLLHNQFSMSDDFFMDRVFKAFDRDADGFLCQQEWVMGMSVFLRGTLDEKIKYCFSIYDLNDDGYISREEMFQMLKNTMVKQPSEEDPDEGTRDLVESMVKKMDQDHDTKVSLEDFQTTVMKERLLIEAFGPCLPTSKTVDQFSYGIFAHV